MNRTDAICLITTLDRFRPAYAEWRSDQAKKLAAAHGTPVADEARAMVDSFARTLAEIETDEAAEVLESMESGRVAVPFWGEMAATIRSEAMENRRGRREAEKFQRDGEPRFRCLECEGRGHVTVYNPAFLIWLRPRFEECQRAGGFPKNWYREAMAKWHRKTVQAITDGGRGLACATTEVELVCNCDSPDAIVFRRQLTRMLESLSDPKAKPVRAAYIGQWTTGRQCLKTFDPHADLTAWFDEHEATEPMEWQPAEGEYAARFGK